MAFSRTFIFIVASAILAVILLTSSLFTVSETEQAIVLQFGAVKHVERTAGLKFKLPFVQKVVIDPNAEGKNGVVPYLPLPALNTPAPAAKVQ